MGIVRWQKGLNMANKFNFKHQTITEEEKPLVYSKYYLVDEPSNRIGYLRGYLDNSGCMPTTWFDDKADMKTPWFHEEFNALVQWVRQCWMKDRKALVRFCYSYTGDSLPLNDDFGSVACKVETDRFSYYIRLNPSVGDYNIYIYCYTNTVKSYGDGIEIVKVTPRKPWQGAYRVYSYGIHEATLDTLEQADALALDMLDIENDDTIMEEEA